MLLHDLKHLVRGQAFGHDDDAVKVKLVRRDPDFGEIVLLAEELLVEGLPIGDQFLNRRNALEQANNLLGFTRLGVGYFGGHFGRETLPTQSHQHFVNLTRRELRRFVNAARDGFHHTPP
ncbi:MAG: hypothetical protein AAB911_00535 [Patescibacteria group bacterium]